MSKLSGSATVSSGTSPMGAAGKVELITADAVTDQGLSGSIFIRSGSSAAGSRGPSRSGTPLLPPKSSPPAFPPPFPSSAPVSLHSY